jgi:hypothetical protein
VKYVMESPSVVKAVDHKIKEVFFLEFAVCLGWLHVASKQTLL